MFNFIKKKIRKNIINFRGWKTDKKIIIIESDDWGSIRLSSKNSFYHLNKLAPLDKDAYNTFDSLESNDDLEALFETLTSIKDRQGNNPIISINNIVSNPDFEKIKDSNFQEYFFEPFTQTLKKYPKHDQVERLYREGIKSKIINLQFHGREHIHVKNWMNWLRSDDSMARKTFDQKMFSIYPKINANCNEQFLDAFATYGKSDVITMEKIIEEGCNLFEEIWGYKADSVVSPCHIWNPDLEFIFQKNHLEFIQSGVKQKIPTNKNGEYSKKRHYSGEKNNLNQIYTVRNVIFEPSLDPDKAWLNEALNEIENAFFWKKPAIISSHRLNYIGFIQEKNRTKNLQSLHSLLVKVLKKWPEVEFYSSSQLGNEIKSTLTK